MSGTTELVVPRLAGRSRSRVMLPPATVHRSTNVFDSLSVSHQWASDDRVCRPPRRKDPRSSNALVVAMVKHGRLTLRGKGGRTEANAGDCVIFSPDWLREAKCEKAAESRRFEQTYAVLVRSEEARYGTMGAAVYSTAHAPSPEIQMAAKILEHLLKPRGQLPESCQHILARTVASLFEIAVEVDGSKGAKPSCAEAHFQNVSRCIQIQLSNPRLSVQMVSEYCDISPRYLSHVLRLKGTSYSNLVWGQRLEKAREWLLAPHDEMMPVSEIAYSLGFKSAAHFSRLFKKRYGMRPSDCRATAQEAG